MSKLFNWAAARLVAAFALALCFATPLVAWADFTKTNLVTSATESYTYKFVGTDSVWNNTANWQDSNGSNPSAVPAKSDSNTWAPILFDQAENQSIAIGAALSVEGWNLRMGLYNGASVQLNNLVKLQSDTATWITADSSSHCTIAHMANKKLVGANPLCLYSANQGGIAWTEELSSSGNGNGTPLPFHYYLAGNGTVAYNGGIAAAAGGAHVIKQADVTLSGTSQVSSKTLVSFTSSSTTFTADAAIKVYDIDGTTLKETVAVTSVRSSGAAIQNTTSALTTADDAVGTCELVQCTDGIVLYYVDGDPDAVVAKTYKPSININFTSGTALSTVADVGYVDYAVPGTSWNNLIGNNGTLSTVTQVDSTGAASTVAGVGVMISGTRGYWTCGSVSAANDLRQGYIDDAAGANASPQVVVSGIPYYSYYAVVYFSNNDANVKFGYVTINGTNYKWDDTTSALVECEGADTDSWGASSPTAWTEGGNYIVTPTIVNADGTFTVVGHRVTDARAGIAAIQIVEVPKTAEEGELVINVSGDTPYTVSEDATYTTVYVTGVGTLAFSGEGTITTTTLNVGAGATVPMGSSITPTTVTGAGTVVCDNVGPGSLGWSDSANWKGVLWLKNYAIAGLNPDTLANASSTLRLTACTGYFNDGNNTKTCEGTLDLQNGTGSYAFAVDNGWSTSGRTVFAKLTGSGTLGVQTKDIGQRYVFRDASGFTGNINLAARPLRVVFGDYDQLSSDPDEGTITVAGGAEATLASGATWTANNGGFRVFGTLNVNGTLASSATATAVKGSGTVVFTGSAPSPTGDAWWKNASWTGTVQMKDVTNLVGGTNWTGTNFLPNDYGNTGSVLELYNCSGWLPNNNNYQCTVPLKVTGTLTINDGISGNKFVVSHLSGSGAICTTSNSATTTLQILEADGFTGYVQLNSKRVVFGNTLPSEYTVGNIYVGEGFSFTVPNSNVAWFGTGGITLAGELKAAALSNFGGGTTITTTDTGVFTLVSNSNADDMNVDYTRIQGTGTLKYEGSAYRCISTNNFPTAMIVENNLTAGLLHRIPNLEVTIGSLSGSGYLRSDWGGSAGDRSLKVLQAKDTTWSGKFWTANPHRFGMLRVAPGASTAGTLTISAIHETAESTTLQVDSGASVNLTGTWVGATTVAGTIGGTGTLTGNLTFSDGATLKANASALTVSGTVTIPAGEGESLTIDAVDLDADEVTILSSESITTETDVSKVTVDGLYTVEAVAGALKLVSTRVEVTVPAINNATVTVSVGGETIGTEAGTYKVAPDAVVTATYAAEAGYEISGQTVYTIDVSNSETTFDPAGSTEVKRYVAQIYGGDSYTTLQAAVDAAVRYSKIIVLANETDGATIPSADNSFYIYTGAFTTGEILDATGDFITTRTTENISISDDYHADKVTATRYSVAAAFMAVTIDGTRTLYGQADANVALTAANAGAIGTKIEFLSGDPASYAELLPMFDYDSETGVYTKVANPVAAVYSGVLQLSVHRTLADAVSSATSGDTVTLLADVTLDASLAIPAGKSLTLNLNGYTLTGPSGKNYAIANSGNITLTGGTITGYGVARNVASGATITVTDGTYTATVANGFINLTDTVGCAVTIHGGTFTAQEAVVATGRSKNSSITVNGGTLTSIDNAVLMDNGSSGYTGNTITVTGGTLNGGITTAGYVACGIYCANDTTVNVTGGTFNITGGCGILARAGKVNVSGTAVINTTGTATGKVGDSRIVVPCAPIVYDSAANYPGYDETTTEFAVSGGTFTANGQDVDCIVQVADEGDATPIAVSGGTFNTAVADTYCAEGFEPKDNGDGTYGVREDKGWVYSAPGYWDYTGTWTERAALGDDKVTISDGATYSNRTASAGQLVTVAMTLSFDDVNDDDSDFGDAKAAIRLAAGETDGTYQFQLYTSDGETKVWTNATVGVTATKEEDYNFVFVLDLTNKTYTASIVSGATTNVLSIGESITAIPFACQGEVTPVQTIDFVGSGTVSSIEGSYEDAPEPEGFVENQVIGVVTLTSAQAEWLNGQGNYDALAEKIATMSQTALDNAYLLNLNIAGDFSYEFGVSDFKVDTAAGKATVYVTLTRTGALAENEVAKPIIGTLKLTGTAEIGTAFAEIGSADLTFDANVDFGNGATTTAVTVDIGENGVGAKFYLPVIE